MQVSQSDDHVQPWYTNLGASDCRSDALSIKPSERHCQDFPCLIEIRLESLSSPNRLRDLFSNSPKLPEAGSGPTLTTKCQGEENVQ